MASTTLAVANGALRLGIAGDTSPAGADTVYGFNGTDTLSTGGQRSGGDRFLDDAGGSFDAPLGYALAFQYLLAEAWKGEPSVILRHLDQDGSCAPMTEDERVSLELNTMASDGGMATAVDPVADNVADGTTGNDSDADFADAGMAAADFFGMS